jgi:ATP-binding cassette subfamily F protein 3
MLLGANCLVLDEPTNNLDIPAAEVLEESLEKFPGTVIVVSHDRYLLDRLVDRVIEVRDGEIRTFEGGYSSYLEKTSAAPLAETVSEAKAGERAKAAFEAKRRRG